MPNQDEQQTNRPMVTDDRESHELIFEAEMAIAHENSKFLQLHAFKPALLCYSHTQILRDERFE